jgi:hypothetical protein
MDGKEKFLEALKIYESKYGSAEALKIQDRLSTLRKQILEDNEAVLEWLPMKKKDQTMESLMEKNYRDLIFQMERGPC